MADVEEERKDVLEDCTKEEEDTKKDAAESTLSDEINLGSSSPEPSPLVGGKLVLTANNNHGVSVFNDLPGELKVEIINFEKVGDGISAYVVFTIRTSTNIPVFRSNELTVIRRFSDFLGLYERLQALHAPKGILVPPPPSKQNLDANKFKVVKDVAKENEFLEQRRISLQHFMDSLVRHPTLRTDAILREFIEFEGILPKATNTQVFSGASASKLLKSVSTAITKMSTPIDEPDQYFFDRAHDLSILERQYSRIVQTFSSLTNNQGAGEGETKLSSTIMNFKVSLEGLASAETDIGMSAKIKRLSEVYETLAKHETIVSQADTVYLYETARNILAIMQAARNLLDERLKCYRRWQDMIEHLSSKRLQKTKMELTGKHDYDKMNLVTAQITVSEQKVLEYEAEFNTISKTIKDELARMDFYRFADMKSSMLSYIEVMLNVQLKNHELWTQYSQFLESDQQ